MPFYYLPNLSASEVNECEPWMAEGTRPALADKEAFRLWCNNPTTEHAFITAVEGKTPALRVNEINPANRLCGLIIDYDAVPDLPLVGGIVARAPTGLRPAWVCRTFSGHCRTLYKFEAPVPLFTKDIARQFMLKLQRELKINRILPGFEAEALLDLSKTYEIGNDWEPIPGDPVIPTNLLLAWINDACSKHKWDREGPTIPLDVIREAASEQWPDGWPNGWSGFELGARGPRFWDEDAGDPTAAIVRESGIQYYSDGGGFQSWEAIFGSQFVRRWADDRLGNAIKAFYFDGKDYWGKSLEGVWGTRLERDVSRALRINDRLSKKAPTPTEESEVERALFSITESRRVEAAAPFVYRPDGVLESGGVKYLNTSTRRPVLPAPNHTEWAEGFPKIANLFDRGFPTVPGVDGEPDPQRQRNHVLSWLRHFYLGALTQNPQRGLALYIAGPAGTGKTLLNKAIIGALMGGSQEASKYLLGTDKFNEPLLNVALWTVDDAVAADDEKSQTILSQTVKQVIANDRIVMRKMFGAGRDAEWLGRLIITLNDDPESLRLLPPHDINIMDKVMEVTMQRIEVAGWEMTDTEIQAELPFLAAFLRDWTPPDYCLPSNPRFGVATYANPALVESAGSTSASASFAELVDAWRGPWFAPGGRGESLPNWHGNPTELQHDLQLNEGLRRIVDGNFRSTAHIGRHLNKMIKEGRPYIRTIAKRTYEIDRP